MTESAIAESVVTARPGLQGPSQAIGTERHMAERDAPRENDAILYLTGSDVRRACRDVDPVATIAEVLRHHGDGRTVLPDEAYLPWTTAEGDSARSLAMPGFVRGSVAAAGTKVINGNPGNVRRGLPRASGVTMLFDVTTARITCIMEGAHISALRTASVTAVAVGALHGRALTAHLDLLPARLPALRDIRLFDLDGDRAVALQRAVSPACAARGIRIEIAPTPEDAVRPAQLIVPVTTTTQGYIPFDWLQPGALLVNVSLDDPMPDVALRADRLLVDDWPLVKADSRRLLGRLYRAGQIVGPDEPRPAGDHGPRPVDATLGQVLTGERPGRCREDDIILVNPFGLAIEDIALASAVHGAAARLGLGVWLER
jgi:ornithine cyclodeaminase/alanine dehydrogenase-like protein (mu-crystallin family)